MNVAHSSNAVPQGTVDLKVIRGGKSELFVPEADVYSLRDLFNEARPKRTDEPDVRVWKQKNMGNIVRGISKLAAIRAASRATGIAHPEGVLRLAKVCGKTGKITNYGLASVRVVTDVGCQKIVAVMNTSDATTATTFKYHGLGTGTTAEASSDTTLVTELTTEYVVDSTRPSGSQTTGATTKVFRSAATVTLDSGTPAITEHGIFSASSAGSLLDRSKFTAVNLDGTSGDSMIATYDLTFTSGG